MKLQISLARRLANMRAHTATHLLHSYINALIPTTKQAGSRVGEDELRFDFTTERLLTLQELEDIQRQINKNIYEAIPVKTNIMNQKDARQQGAKAFFEDKYGDKVRVVSIGDLSQELCGGTHTANTKDIGSFVITKQEAVASGIKRITAITGPKTYQHIQQQTVLLNNIINLCGVKSPSQIISKINKITEESKKIQQEYAQLQSAAIQAILQQLPKQNNKSFNQIINIDDYQAFKNIPFKIIVQETKTYYTLLTQNSSDFIVLLYTHQGNFAILSFGSDQNYAKDTLKRLGLHGGGSGTMVQGKTSGENLTSLV